MAEVTLADELTVVDIVKGSWAVMIERKHAVLLYAVALTVLATIFECCLWNFGEDILPAAGIAGTLLNILGLGLGVAGIGLWVLMWMGQYLLWEAMLGRPIGFPGDRARHFLAFFGMQILIFLGCMFGLILLILPGLIVVARWTTAPAFLIEERMGVINAMRASWNQMRGNATPVVLIYIAIGLVWIVAGGITGALQADLATDRASLLEILLSQFAGSVQSAVLIAIGVFLFDRLHGRTRTLSGVFE